MQTSDKPRPPLDSLVLGIIGGIIALKLPQVLGGGYGWVQLAIDGQLALNLLLVLLVAKVFALSFAVSSGGVFAPSLFVGAMLGGAARVPIARLLILAEMTGVYQLLVIQPEGVQYLSQHLSPTGINPVPA